MFLFNNEMIDNCLQYLVGSFDIETIQSAPRLTLILKMNYNTISYYSSIRNLDPTIWLPSSLLPTSLPSLWCGTFQWRAEGPPPVKKELHKELKPVLSICPSYCIDNMIWAVSFLHSICT